MSTTRTSSTPPILQTGETADFNGVEWLITSPEPELEPEPEPLTVINWNQWRLSSLASFKVVLDALYPVDPVLVSLFPTMFAQLPSGLPELVQFWNGAISQVNAEPLGAVFNRLSQLMSDFDIPLRMSNSGILTVV